MAEVDRAAERECVGGRVEAVVRILGGGGGDGGGRHGAVGHPEVGRIGAIPVVVAPAVNGGGEVFLVVGDAVAVGVAVGAELPGYVEAMGVGGAVGDRRALVAIRRGAGEPERVLRVVGAVEILPGVGEAVGVGVNGCRREVDDPLELAVVAVGVVLQIDVSVFEAVGQSVAVGVGVPRGRGVRLVLPGREEPPGGADHDVGAGAGDGRLLVLRDRELGIAAVEGELLPPVEAVGVGVENGAAHGERLAVELIPEKDVAGELAGTILLDREQGVGLADRADADIERPAVGQLVAVGVALHRGGRKGLPLVRIDLGDGRAAESLGAAKGCRDARVAAELDIILGHEELLQVGEPGPAGAAAADRGSAGNELVCGAAVPERLVVEVMDHRAGVLVNARRIHEVLVGVAGCAVVALRGEGRKSVQDLPAVGHAVGVGVPVQRVGAEEELLVVGEAVVVDVLGGVPLGPVAGVLDVGGEIRRIVGGGDDGVEDREKRLAREHAVDLGAGEG